MRRELIDQFCCSASSSPSPCSLQSAHIMPRYARHIAAPPRHGRAPPPPPLVAPNLYHGVPPAPPAADPLLPLPSSTKEWRIFGLGVLVACLICWILRVVLRWFRRTVADAVADGIAKAWREDRQRERRAARDADDLQQEPGAGAELRERRAAKDADDRLAGRGARSVACCLAGKCC